MQSARLRRRLVSGLEAAGADRSAAVRDAFLSVPREAFVPEEAAKKGREAGYEDDVVVTRWGANGVPLSSSSQPRIMAHMLRPTASAS